jgi:OmpA-OmpF porin, OOP family
MRLTRRALALLTVSFVSLSGLARPAVNAFIPAPGSPRQDVSRVDYLTFARGAVPVSIGGAGASQGATYEHAIRMIDGDPSGFTFVQRATAETDTEFVYALPAATTFDRFAVPNVLETPSPAQTFTRQVEVFGSASGPDEGYTLLASAVLQTPAPKGDVTEIPVVATAPAHWVKLRLVGGVEIQRAESAFEFSEIIGNGTQDTPALDLRFHGAWTGPGVTMALEQDGPVVSGCYDSRGRLNGTVQGNILRALGTVAGSGTKSAFILSVAPDGTLRGVRSTSRGPFRLYAGSPGPPGAADPCAAPPPPTLGCESVVYGITFAFDSAEIRPESEPVLAHLYEGLQSDRRRSIVIEGHTSNEGGTSHNQGLSERRAVAVVADLVRRGLDPARLSALGVGESRPIAGNDDESGRSLNRRVEIRCR